MPEIVPQEHGGAVNRFKKGESGNLNGRPKRIYTILKEHGYSKEDIRDAFTHIGWQNEDDINEIIDDKEKPMILRLIAKAFKKGADKGDFRYVSEILQHVIGKPKEQIESKNLHKILVEYVNPNDKALPSSQDSAEGY